HRDGGPCPPSRRPGRPRPRETRGARLRAGAGRTRRPPGLPRLRRGACAAGRGISWRELAWILVAMVGARSAAMGFNRLADQRLDARNPRTAGRELPRGALSRGEVWLFVMASAATLVVAAAMLNPLCLALSPVALLVIFGYSYTKRFTALSHLFLGLALALAPLGAWLAIRGHFDPP